MNSARRLAAAKHGESVAAKHNNSSALHNVTTLRRNSHSTSKLTIYILLARCFVSQLHSRLTNHRFVCFTLRTNPRPIIYNDVCTRENLGRYDPAI